MNGIQRALIGASGGVLAVLTKYLAQDHAFVSHWANVHDPRFSDIMFGYAILTPILIILGAVVAGFSDEINKLKLLAMGVAAPALITTMAGGAALPGPTALTAPPSAAAPHPIGPAGWYLPLSPVNSALAEETNPKLAQAAVIQKGVEAFFGAGKGEPRYWVIAGAFRDKAEAAAFAANLNSQDSSLHAFVGKRQPGNDFYPVIVGDFVPVSEATRLRDSVSQLSNLNGQQPYLSSFPDRRP